MKDIDKISQTAFEEGYRCGLYGDKYAPSFDRQSAATNPDYEEKHTYFYGLGFDRGSQVRQTLSQKLEIDYLER